MGAEQELEEQFKDSFLEQVDLSAYTTVKCGGIARYFISISNPSDLVKAVQTAKKYNLSYFVFGGGSNTLFLEEGLPDLFINYYTFKLDQVQQNGAELTLPCSVALSALVAYTAQLGLSGLAWAAGIPGSLGGAIYGNAGAFGAEIKDSLKEVTVFEEGEVKTIPATDLAFSYRHSPFQGTQSLLLSCKLQLIKSAIPTVQAEVLTNIKTRTAKQPHGATLGSTFKNPENKSAGQLIEAAGLKGFTVGGATVSSQHANFIINTASAKPSDILNIINTVREEVQKKFGVTLVPEINIIPKQSTSNRVKL